MDKANIESTKGGEPLFNIGVVSRMTDINEATLRIWERRYDFPQPARTAGRQRLYSQQEILRLKWVKTRVDEGMQVSKAIQALYRLEQEEGAPHGAPASRPPRLSLPQEAGDASLPSFHRRLLD